MRVVITAGTGAGQYAQITSYNPGTKVANVAKESDGTAGWNTWHPTNGIAATLDATTTYPTEPKSYSSRRWRNRSTGKSFCCFRKNCTILYCKSWKRIHYKPTL